MRIKSRILSAPRTNLQKETTCYISVAKQDDHTKGSRTSSTKQRGVASSSLRTSCRMQFAAEAEAVATATASASASASSEPSSTTGASGTQHAKPLALLPKNVAALSFPVLFRLGLAWLGLAWLLTWLGLDDPSVAPNRGGLHTTLITRSRDVAARNSPSNHRRPATTRCLRLGPLPRRRSPWFSISSIVRTALLPTPSS